MLQKTMDFVQVEKPLVSLQNISDNVEFFIFRMAPNLIHPSDLINKEISVSKKPSNLLVKEKRIEVDTQTGETLNFLSLMIPDSSSGKLGIVKGNITCQATLKEGGCKYDNESKLDSNHFITVAHQISNVAHRDFYNPESKTEKKETKIKKEKSSKRKSETLITNDKPKSIKDEKNTSFDLSAKKKKKLDQSKFNKSFV
ncbi:hypothetical protein Anas_09827 [Armadillidium nasatum]|uniref:Uncharacterized protein n=1 Tax=Armadillidium nasatum TaxID=96803 RepID=A0A5N5TGE6_9CRUS|nr:hypothetical protein Anas_09827 [Armadillidium nasatum]